MVSTCCVCVGGDQLQTSSPASLFRVAARMKSLMCTGHDLPNVVGHMLQYVVESRCHLPCIAVKISQTRRAQDSRYTSCSVLRICQYQLVCVLHILVFLIVSTCMCRVGLLTISYTHCFQSVVFLVFLMSHLQTGGSVGSDLL